MSRVRRLKKSQRTSYLYEGVKEEPFISLTVYLDSWKNTGTNNLAACKHLGGNKERSSSQHGFAKNKSYQANLIPSYNRAISLVGKGGNKNVIHIEFSEPFDTISRNILISKLSKCGKD